MKKILVTGGAGFIGSHLVDFLIKRGDKVFVIDSLISAGSYRNQKANYTYCPVENVWEHSIKFDECYYLASPASPSIYQKHPFETISANTVGLLKTIDRCDKLLFTSTSEVYGNPNQHPQKESYNGNVNPVGPRACYNEAKRLGETICYEKARQGQDVRVVRIFNTYGPRMHPDDGRALPNFIKQIKSNQAITIYGDGTQTRSFCYIDDTIRGLVRVMGGKVHHLVYNIGNPEEVTINEMVKVLLKVYDKPNHKKIYLDLSIDDPVKRKPDIGRIIDDLGWSPKIGLEEGLRKVHNSMNDRL